MTPDEDFFSTGDNRLSVVNDERSPMKDEKLPSIEPSRKKRPLSLKPNLSLFDTGCFINLDKISCIQDIGYIGSKKDMVE